MVYIFSFFSSLNRATSSWSRWQSSMKWWNAVWRSFRGTASFWTNTSTHANWWVFCAVWCLMCKLRNAEFSIDFLCYFEFSSRYICCIVQVTAIMQELLNLKSIALFFIISHVQWACQTLIAAWLCPVIFPVLEERRTNGARGTRCWHWHSSDSCSHFENQPLQDAGTWTWPVPNSESKHF